MFEPISESLSQLSAFAVLGFFLAAFYEIIRIIRLFKRQSDLAVGMTDFLFLSIAGVITFAYSIELGSGSFRWFFVFGEAFGAAVYFLTIGRLISLASNFIVRCVKRFIAIIIQYIFNPIKKKVREFLHFLMSKFVNVYDFLIKHVKISSNHLKSRVKVLYNKKTTKKFKSRSRFPEKSAGEKRNVVKGKIRNPRGGYGQIRKT